MEQYTAIIDVMLRKSILDVQGKTVEHALHSTGFKAIEQLHIGKHFKMTVSASSKDEAFSIVENATKQLLCNQIMEDYSIQILTGNA